MRALSVLVLATLLVGARTARAEDTPRQRFDATVGRVRASVAAANQRVKQTLTARDWNGWNAAHDAYVLTLMRAVPDVENAISNFMLGVLAAGGQLDGPTMGAIHDAADETATWTRQRVMAGAYATLTRRGVRPDRRSDALDLLAREGVYDLSPAAKSGGGSVPLRPAPPAQGLGESPLTGKVPGTTEAAEALSKWQYAYMSAQSIERKIATYESELLTLPENSPNRPQVQKNLDQARAEQVQLLESVRTWRQKYYASGGR